MLPSVLQSSAHAPLTFLTFKLPLGFFLSLTADHTIAVEETVKRCGLVGGAPFKKVHAEEATLFPTSASHRQIKPPSKAVREHSQRHPLIECITKQLFLVFGEVRTRAFHLDKDEVVRPDTKTIVHTPTTHRVLPHYLAAIKRVPAQLADDSIHRDFARVLLAALGEVDIGQPSDQGL